MTGQPLSAREREALRYAALEGVQGAARRMGLTTRTVEQYIGRAYTKLDAHTATEAHLRLGWLRVPGDDR